MFERYFHSERSRFATENRDNRELEKRTGSFDQHEGRPSEPLV